MYWSQENTGNDEKTINLAILCFVLASAGLILIGPASATISFFDQTPKIEKLSRSEAIQAIEQTPKKNAQAPEPGTLALFGSGLLAMVMGFLRKVYAVTKRIFDIVMSSVLLVLAWPLMLLAAVLVKITSPGPVIYSQIRVGLNGTCFKIYKFRTMRADAEKNTGAVWAKVDDNRITSIGKILRKTRIDELPQLFNVLTGNMSLIGPRPERPEFVETLKVQIPDYEKRLSVKPGITGLAQVYHKYDETIEDVKKKVDYDIKYIENMCLWSDLGITMKTVGVVLTGTGAR